MKQSKGALSRQTQKFKGKDRPTPIAFTTEFKLGSTVLITPRPYILGVPPMRYSYRHGQVVEKRGSSYVIEFMDGKKKKQILSHPIHLTASKSW